MNEPSLKQLLGPNGFLFEKRGGTGILLIHGLTGTPAEMRHFGRQLARRGLTVACPQLAGHCNSVHALKSSSWQDWYRTVEESFEALSRQCSQVYVAGLSMGALLALQLAAQKKERLAGLTLLSTTFFYDGWNVPKWRQRLLLPLVIYSPLRHFLSWKELPPYGIKDERVRAMVHAVLENRDARSADKIGHFKTPASVIRESKRLIRATKQCLHDVCRPMLVVHSNEDDMASVENAHYVARKVASDQVETYFVDDSYHVLTLDKRKDDIAVRVASFCQPVFA